MNILLNLDGFDIGSLAAAWRTALPFPHVVLDAVFAPAALSTLREAVRREPHTTRESPLYEHFACADDPSQPALRRIAEELGAPSNRAAIRSITQTRVETASARSYVYMAGHFLLPHTDYDPTHHRRLSYALYLSDAGNCHGGELELFDGDVPARRIEPRANRLVLMDVSERSLHQVREVTAGARASIAGWLYG